MKVFPDVYYWIIKVEIERRPRDRNIGEKIINFGNKDPLEALLITWIKDQPWTILNSIINNLEK